MRPRWAFLYLTRFGSSISDRSPRLFWCPVEDFAAADPYLHPDRPVNRHRGGLSVIDVCPQRVEGNPAFFVLFRSRNFSSAKPAAAHDANAFGAHAHRRCNRHFHGAPERHPAFELPRDILGEQKTVQLGTLNLMNENFHLFVGDLLELLFQLRDLFTAPPDHDAGAGRMDRDHGFLGSSVDQDPRDPGLFQPVVDIVPDAQIFLEFPGKIFVVVPSRIPRAQDAEPTSDRMYSLPQRPPD